jgi:sugar (pentulose or hexulose) kinase
MSELLFAAVDLGAESGRVIAGRFDGHKLHLEVAHRFPNTPTHAAGTLYWDVLRLWSDIGDGLTKVAQMGEIAGIGVDTWGVDFGLLDENDQLLGNPVPLPRRAQRRHD